MDLIELQMALGLAEFSGMVAFTVFYWWLFRPIFQAQMRSRIGDAKRWWREVRKRHARTDRYEAPPKGPE